MAGVSRNTTVVSPKSTTHDFHPSLQSEPVPTVQNPPEPMDKKPPHRPDLKGFLAYLDGKTSPRKMLEIRASITTAYLIAHIQRQSRLKE